MKAKVRTFSGTTSNEVTQREIDNRALARKAAAEGFVLLKNEEHFLPAKKVERSRCTVREQSKPSREVPVPGMSMSVIM